jgi:putative flippase GtrA
MAFFADASSDRSAIGRLVHLIRWAAAQRAIRFLVVGGLNTVFGYGLFALFYLVSHQRQPSLIASTVLGVMFNYFTTGRLVFANKGFRAMLPFFAGYGVVLLANMAALEIFARLGVPALLGQAIALPLMVALSYLINRFGVFARNCRTTDQAR